MKELLSKKKPLFRDVENSLLIYIAKIREKLCSKEKGKGVVGHLFDKIMPVNCTFSQPHQQKSGMKWVIEQKQCQF